MISYVLVKAELHALLTSPLDGGQCSVWHPNPFNPEENIPITHCIRGCVEPRTGLDASGKNKYSFNLLDVFLFYRTPAHNLITNDQRIPDQLEIRILCYLLHLKQHSTNNTQVLNNQNVDGKMSRSRSVDRLVVTLRKLRITHWRHIDDLLTFQSRQVILQKQVTRLRASFRAPRIEPRCLLIFSECLKFHVYTTAWFDSC